MTFVNNKLHFGAYMTEEFEIGNRFSFALNTVGAKNKEIAERFNISSQQISNLKKSDKINDLICRICLAYNININWVISGIGTIFNSNQNNNFQNANLSGAAVGVEIGSTNKTVSNTLSDCGCDDELVKSIVKELCKKYKNDMDTLKTLLFQLTIQK